VGNDKEDAGLPKGHTEAARPKSRGRSPFSKSAENPYLQPITPKEKRKARGMKSGERSMGWLRRCGYTVDIVERWITMRQGPIIKGMIRKDLLGFADLLAFRGLEPILLVQTTIDRHVERRKEQTHDNERLLAWLQAGHRAEIHWWIEPSKLHPKWRLRVLELYAEDSVPYYHKKGARSQWHVSYRDQGTVNLPPSKPA